MKLGYWPLERKGKTMACQMRLINGSCNVAVIRDHRALHVQRRWIRLCAEARRRLDRTPPFWFVKWSDVRKLHLTLVPTYRNSPLGHSREKLPDRKQNEKWKMTVISDCFSRFFLEKKTIWLLKNLLLTGFWLVKFCGKLHFLPRLWPKKPEMANFYTPKHVTGCVESGRSGLHVSH